MTNATLIETARRVWNAEAYLIRHTGRSDPESQQQSLRDALRAKEAAYETVDMLAGLRVDDGDGDLADLKDRFDQFYLQMAALILTCTAETCVRAACLERLNRRAATKWDDARRRLAGKSGQERETARARISSHIDDALCRLDRASAGTSALSTSKRVRGPSELRSDSPFAADLSLAYADQPTWEGLTTGDGIDPARNVAKLTSRIGKLLFGIGAVGRQAAGRTAGR